MPITASERVQVSLVSLKSAMYISKNLHQNSGLVQWERHFLSLRCAAKFFTHPGYLCCGPVWVMP